MVAYLPNKHIKRPWGLSAVPHELGMKGPPTCNPTEDQKGHPKLQKDIEATLRYRRLCLRKKKNLEIGILEECGVRQKLPSRCGPLKNG